MHYRNNVTNTGKGKQARERNTKNGTNRRNTKKETSLKGNEQDKGLRKIQIKKKEKTPWKREKERKKVTKHKKKRTSQERPIVNVS